MENLSLLLCFFLGCPLPLFTIVNVHFLHYYLSLHAYAREPPLNHLDLTSLGSTFPSNLVHNCHLSIFTGRETEKGKGAQSPWDIYSTRPDQPRDISPHPISNLSTTKVSSTLRHFSLPRAAGGMFPLRFAKSFLHAPSFFFLCYFLDRRGRGWIL